MNAEQIIEILREIIGEVKEHRPEVGDSYGNYDDSYSDGVESAYYDIYHALKERGIEL